MYLKSIEIHGFKSFANKILLEFKDGITAIVGPNGSGKSNIADAVRWVLGEQSAKQLRGVSMQDVIFSGSEARKPLGYAYVIITFDNSDHKLPVDYEEISVGRRVYRSGESEYLINGNTCRLKDVQDMFMDTGIGKEGYSIIGQGQIERILSTKPEDRRELFDEAAGIVKFKKRKAIAERNLFEASDNLTRVNDIAGELEKQIGPLEKQSEVAREYLRLKEILKNLEVNNFLAEYDRSGKQKQDIDDKYDAAVEDLNSTKAANENAEAEYKRLETEIIRLDASLEENKNARQELLISKEKKEGNVKLIRQQIENLDSDGKRVAERIAEINSEIDEKFAERADFEKQKKNFDERLKECADRKNAASEALEILKKELEELTRSIDDENAGLLKLATDDGHIKTNIGHYDTVLEQHNIRRAELSRRLLGLKSDENDSNEILESLKKKFDSITEEINGIEKQISESEKQLTEKDNTLKDIAAEYEKLNAGYLGKKSRLDALKTISERYDGYSQSVKKIMEQKSSFPGICGVVSELISTGKKYETAIETALGASIQHIVTEDENTAKAVIEYLKKNKLGRATFLPITAIGDGMRGKPEDRLMNENGVIGTAASLATTDSKYAGIAQHLLGSFVVVDNVDNALRIARKYDYNTRLVTLEGELLSPGGSIAGGAFRNQGNLLGRKRELEELEAEITLKKEEIDKLRQKQQKVSESRKELRNRIEEMRSGQKDRYVSQNTAKLELNKEKEHLNDILSKISDYKKESSGIEEKLVELKKQIESQQNSLTDNAKRHEELTNAINEQSGKLMQLRIDEGEKNEAVSKIAVEYANIEQAGGYTNDNIRRIDGEIEKLRADTERINESSKAAEEELAEKKKMITALSGEISDYDRQITELDGSIRTLTEKKDSIKREHKEFFDSWSELTKRITDLEKEVMRLQTQREKLGEIIDASITYIWEEYRLTVTTAEEYRDINFKTSTARKDIGECKASIKALGEVNVNAIEEYKNVSERYSVMTAQRDDLIASTEKIRGIISDLDDAMRKQFAERFALIREQFNIVFRELFGGGKGELELVEDEDMLEAGIRIIAQPPGKKLQNMMQLSGGEKALTAISLLFAIQNLKPSPFCLLDEIEAALDDSNVKRFSSYLKKLTKNSQFIVITHRRGTMTAADSLYGITMQEKGVSTLVSVSLIEEKLEQ